MADAEALDPAAVERATSAAVKSMGAAGFVMPPSAARPIARAALAAAGPTVDQVAEVLHGHPVKAAPYLGVWECTCGAPVRPIRDQAERVVALWGAL